MQANEQYIDQAIKLHDGRRLAYHDLGPRHGQPVFYFHGWPSSRQEWRVVLSQKLLKQLGVRLILPNRPGIGGSTFLPDRRILDWPNDVLALADALGIERFAVV